MKRRKDGVEIFLIALSIENNQSLVSERHLGA